LFFIFSRSLRELLFSMLLTCNSSGNSIQHDSCKAQQHAQQLGLLSMPGKHHLQCNAKSPQDRASLDVCADPTNSPAQVQSRIAAWKQCVCYVIGLYKLHVAVDKVHRATDGLLSNKVAADTASASLQQEPS
jgi:hypothetical protein